MRSPANDIMPSSVLRYVLVLVVLAVFAGCGAPGPRLPECGSAETLDLVGEFIQRDLDVSPEGFSIELVEARAGMMGDEERCLAVGCDDYVSKPIDFDKLLEKLARIHQEESSGDEDRPEPLPFHPNRSQGTVDTLEKHDPPELELGCTLEYPAEEPFRSLSQKFIDKIRARLPELDRAVEERDFPLIGQMAHWIKGTGGTVGLPQLSEISLQIEEAVKRHSLDETRAHCQRLGSLVSMP